MNDPYPIFGISAGAATTAYLIFGGAALATLLYCIKVARRERQPWPLAVFGGSALLITYEPFNNFLAHCAYPTGPNQQEMLTWFGQHVPWSTWLIYMFYFSFAVPLLVQWLDRGITMATFAKFYACTVAACAAFEPLFCNVHVGIRWWYYYGDNQAFAFTGLPMFWWFANSMAVVGMGAIFHLLKKHVFTNAAQQWLFVPLAPLVLYGLHASAAAPVFAAIQSTDSVVLGSLATLTTIAISLLYVWLLGKATCVRSGTTHDAPAQSVLVNR
ncbi:hypothetical protein BOO86_15420 [Mycobacterium sp. CBMA 234]|uniref:hypothetical protein n=1 Tax=Mycolicibacterium sp. CBMA 234 TaxID=1918495 RepID=UPI0012DE9368|nr:hypothetical protein [Mycolicibacterium sp. CBMA 234]MUL65864.1 hypothetical protein [Mycolicibacterium sp. CBMA 234]